MKIVPKIIDSNNTIIISIKTELNGENKENILKIYNPFDKNLKYKALIGPTKSKEFVSTSVISIQSKLFSIETWPYLFLSIILYDFKFE